MSSLSFARFPRAALLSVPLALATSGAPRLARADLVEECAHAAEASQELRASDRLVESRDKLRFCARDACPVVVRADCRKWLAEVDDALPSVVIIASDDQDKPVTEVTVHIDDREVAQSLDGKPIVVDPGKHRFVFEAMGYETVSQDWVIRTAEKNRDLRVVFRAEGQAPRPEPSAGIPTLSWILFGVGGVALGTGAYLGFDARSDVSTMRDTCAPTCPSDDVDHAKRQLLYADIALGVGVVSIGAATWLALSSGDREPSSVTLGATPRGATAQWRTRF